MSHWKHSGTAQAGQDDGGGMEVLPGDKTGCYYILLSGLYKNAKWQHIKDFLRKGGVQMDNVEVFPQSNTGWVRLYGKTNYTKAMELFTTKQCNGHRVIADGKNVAQPVYVRNLKAGPPGTPAAATSAHPDAFSHQIPSLGMAGPSGYMPQNVGMSYANAYHATTPSFVASPAAGYVASPATGIVVSPGYQQGPGAYEQDDVEYYKAHPTQGHHAPVVHRTGYEGNELYAASSRDFVESLGAMSLRATDSEAEKTAAEWKIRVQRPGTELLTREEVGHFIRSCAPASAKHVLRIDIPKSSLGNPAQLALAVIWFGNADACAVARDGMFDKEIDGMRMVQGPGDEPMAPAGGQQQRPMRADSHGDDAAVPAVETDAELLARAPKGPRDTRSIREQKRDRRHERDYNKKLWKTERAAGGGASSSRGHAQAAPGAPGTSASGGAPQPERNAPVVDGTTAHRQNKYKHEHNRHRRGG